MSTFEVERKVCEITYIERGGEQKVVEVKPEWVEKQPNGDVTYKYWDPEVGFVSVWISARHVLETRFKTVLEKVSVD